MSESEAPLKAVILVGGQGTRLQPLTNFLPKPMVPLLNRPFLEHTIAYLGAYGVEDVILASSYLPGVIRDYFGDGGGLGVSLAYSVEETPLGTAGAVKQVERYLDGTFIVLNGDIFTDLDIHDMLSVHRSKNSKATISLVSVDNPAAFGLVETDAGGRVKRFIEKPSPGDITTSWINAGTYILEPEVLQYVPEGRYMFERGLFPGLLEKGEPVYGYKYSGYWLDMGTPQKYHRLNVDLLAGKATSLLERYPEGNGISCGRRVRIHPSAIVEGPAVIGDGCVIRPEAQIRGPVAIGSGCHVGDKATVRAAVLWPNCRIGKSAGLENCIIGSGTTVGDNHQAANCVICTDNGVINQVSW